MTCNDFIDWQSPVQASGGLVAPASLQNGDAAPSKGNPGPSPAVSLAMASEARPVVLSPSDADALVSMKLARRSVNAF